MIIVAAITIFFSIIMFMFRYKFVIFMFFVALYNAIVANKHILIKVIALA